MVVDEDEEIVAPEPEPLEPVGEEMAAEAADLPEDLSTLSLDSIASRLLVLGRRLEEIKDASPEVRGVVRVKMALLRGEEAYRASAASSVAAPETGKSARKYSLVCRYSRPFLSRMMTSALAHGEVLPTMMVRAHLREVSRQERHAMEELKGEGRSALTKHMKERAKVKRERK